MCEQEKNKTKHEAGYCQLGGVNGELKKTPTTKEANKTKQQTRTGHQDV